MRFGSSMLGMLPLAVAPFLHTATAAVSTNNTFQPSPGYKTFSISTNANVSRVLISNPPINLLDGNMIRDFSKLLTSLQESPAENSKVYIFSSADPHFFISHLDLRYLSSTHPPPPPFTPNDVNIYYNVTKLFASVPAILIGEISGKGISGGDEISVQLDMRFASPGAQLSAPETTLGVSHAIGGIQYLVRLIGPGRAAEYLLSAKGADAQTMADIGWVNRAFGSKASMEMYVDRLAARIGLFEQGGLNATKQAIRYGFGPRPGSVDADIAEFNRLAALPSTQVKTDEFLALGRNETRSPFELGLPDTALVLDE